MPLLLVLACACFVSGLSIRVTDPMIPAMAIDLATAEANVSLLASAYAIPYALIQPILGPLGDRIGKALIIKVCLAVMTAATALAMIATSIEMMFAARVLGGLAGGGIIPLAIATVGDRVPFEQRQVALSKVLTAMIFAIVCGSAGAGYVASQFGWRGVFAVTTALCAIALVIALVSLHPRARTAAGSKPVAISSAREGYARIFANPLSYVCYGAVFWEGLLIIGLLPFIATLLAARDAGGVFEAGLVLAGMAVGGLIYTLVFAKLIQRMGGVGNLVRMGGIAATAGFLAIALQGSWQFEMVAFVLLGLGFYSIHNSLQTQATELAPGNRGAAVSLHAFFFFLGQSVGPLFYAAAFSAVAPPIVMVIVAIVGFLLSMALAAVLARSKAEVAS